MIACGIQCGIWRVLRCNACFLRSWLSVSSSRMEDPKGSFNTSLTLGKSVLGQEMVIVVIVGKQTWREFKEQDVY